MKRVLIIFFFYLAYFGYGQSYYKTGNPIGDGWISSDAIHISNSTASVSSGYSESNTSPSASGSNNAVFNNCSPNNTTYSLTSPTISSAGYSNIRVGFGRRISSTFPSVSLEWFDGSVWNTITSNAASGASATWSTTVFDLPSSANNNAQLQFRFSYQTSTSSNCTAPPNFRVDDFWVGANFKLPIQLTSFDLSFQNGKPNIRWSSLSEQNNHYYSLERSTNAKEFDQIRKINGFGLGTTDKKIDYIHVDQNPLPGINYYRLRQVDIDGTETVYPVKSIFIKPDKTIIYPTVFDHKLSVLFEQPIQIKNEWKLINMHGQSVANGRFDNQSLNQEIHLGFICPGVYSFIIFENTKKERYKLIKK